jgi:hypothetical protein
MNLKEIRTAMFAQADWAPTQSPEAITRVNGFINRAYNQLALEAPFLFFESKVHLATEKDVKSLGGIPASSVYDRIELAGTNTLPLSPTGRDPWTWKVTFTHSQATSAPTKFNAWKYDRSWDGRMIEITTHNGTLIRNQIRSVWNKSGTYHFTLVRPWDIDTFGDGTANDDDGIPGFKYRVFTEAYNLPDDLIELKSARLRDETNNYPLDVFGQQEAEEHQLDGPDSQVAAGIPRVIFRRGHQRLQGPSVPPVAKADINADGEVQTVWRGPEPPGSFQYKVTYTWGKRDVEFQLPGMGHWEGFAQPLNILNTTTFPSNPVSSTVTGGDSSSRNRVRTPRFESPASPESEVADTTEFMAAIKLSLPNITYALGYLTQVVFGGSTYTRQSLNQSGMYIRIYRKRIRTDLRDYGALLQQSTGLGTSQLDSADDYYLLAEFRADKDNGGVFYDNGEFLPDYNRRLRDINGYQTMAFYPKPDKRYLTEIRGVIRPKELVDDSDAPEVHAEAINVLLERAMVYLYENMGNPAMSQLSNQKYQEALLTLSKRYGDLRPPATPVLRRMTRASSSYRSTNSYRKWYTTSS